MTTARMWNGVAAVIAAGLAAVPAALADPPGHGLLSGQHVSHCVGAPLPGGVYDGYVTLLPSGGSTFWVNGVHLVIQSFVYTPAGGAPEPYTIGQGQRRGLEGAPTVICQGHFEEAYTVRSTSVAVP